MAVYVDWLMSHGWVMYGKTIQSCHMYADSEAELVEFAVSIGLKPRYLQRKSALHFDLTPTKRKLAVEAGAIELNRREGRELMKRVIAQAREQVKGTRHE